MRGGGAMGIKTQQQQLKKDKIPELQKKAPFAGSALRLKDARSTLGKKGSGTGISVWRFHDQIHAWPDQ